MKLGLKKANEAFEEHLQYMVSTEPDVVWSYLRPAQAKPKDFVPKLRAWAAAVDTDEPGRRPCNARLLREMRTSYLNLLDAYDMLRGHSRRFPQNIYTKRQVDKANALARATLATHFTENTDLIRTAVATMKYRKGADVTDYKIEGFPPETVTKALIYWCLTKGGP